MTFSAYGDMEALRVTDTEKWSPYEFTAANEYLRRSQELAGYTRHHDSNNFAKKAQTNIKDAKTVATRRKRAASSRSTTRMTRACTSPKTGS